jgi:3-hydroxybutyryl-CoA dehydrogenase
MALDAARGDLIIGVIGAGAMGRGIMQVSVQGGMKVVAYDAQPGAAAKGRDFVAGMIGRAVEKGSVSKADGDAAIARLTVADTLEALAGAHVIVEAIVERLDIKQELFQKLDAMLSPDVILASNTSSLPITAIAATCKRPERVAGLHFFNPVPLMKLVEVIPGLKTAPWVTEALLTVSKRMTREPVVCTDSPGFIVNHIGRAYAPEGGRILAEGIATHAEIDRILTGAPGFRMGPFTLQDLVGADVSVSVMESLLAQFYGEPMYAPQPIQRLRVDGGLYGQKTGQGWYAYTDGKKVEPDARPVPKARAKSFWVLPKSHQEELRAPFIDILKAAGILQETGEKPSDDALIVHTPIGYDITTAATELKLDPARSVGVDVLFGAKGPRTVMVTPATRPDIRDAAHAAFAHDGQPVVVINDSPGFIAQRVVAHIINVACQIAQRGIAAPADIDKGAKLGLGYPFGPLEWGDRIGAGQVCFILERLHKFYGEPRYRPSPWLKRRAALGLSLLAPEGRDRTA